MANEAAIKRIYCNRCKSTTRHVSKGRYIHKWESPDGDIQGEIEYCLLICAGCEDGSLEVTECDSEGFLGDGTPEYRTSYLPKRGRDELIPKTFRKLPGHEHNRRTPPLSIYGQPRPYTILGCQNVKR